MDGLAPSTDDVVALAGPVLRHRMALNFSARAEGATTAGVIERLCAQPLLKALLMTCNSPRFSMKPMACPPACRR